jgi:hypothetical protein
LESAFILSFMVILNIITSILIFSTLAKETQAYLDPGTGSYIFQILLAALFSSLFFAKRIFTFIKSVPLKIKDIFGGRKSKNEKE